MAPTSLTIQRQVPLTQETEISNQGDFAPTVTEQALDTLCMELQQVSARTGQLRGTWITNTNYNYGDIVTDGINGNNTGNLYTCALSNTSGVWATDLANGDWSLALNIQGIINSLPQIANNQVFGNISGMTATPTGVGLSAMIDSALGNTQGSLLYRSGSAWTFLPPGTTGQILKTQGAAANPAWATSSGSGTITQVTAGTGLTGGGSSGAVTLAFDMIANNALLANVSGGTAAPGATTLSAFLDTVLGSAQGSIIFRNGLIWTVLTPGSSGQFLQTQGASANPQWATPSASSQIIKAGTAATSGGGTGSVSFGTPFPTSITSVTASINNATSIPDIGELIVNIGGLSTSGFTVYTTNSSSGAAVARSGIGWIAVGT